MSGRKWYTSSSSPVLPPSTGVSKKYPALPPKTIEVSNPMSSKVAVPNTF